MRWLKTDADSGQEFKQGLNKYWPNRVAISYGYST